MGRMEELVRKLNETSYAYYVLDNPIVSDKEWDAMYDELCRLEASTGVRLPDSPTRRVGGEPLSAFAPWRHEVRLWSMDKAQSPQALSDWEARAQKLRQAAVDAGAEAARRVGHVFSAHVIPRAMPEVFCMLALDVGEGPARRHMDGCAQCGGCEGGRRACGLSWAPGAGAAASEPKPAPAEAAPTWEQMRTWKVVRLRQYARRLEGFPMSPNEIRYAKKKDLLDALRALLGKETD